MPYSEPTDLAVIACPGGESFANAVIKHLKNMYKHRFTLKNDAISKRYSLDKNELIKDINLAHNAHYLRGRLNSNNLVALLPRWYMERLAISRFYW